MPMKSFETMTLALNSLLILFWTHHSSASIPDKNQPGLLNCSSCFRHTCGLQCAPGQPSGFTASLAYAFPSASTREEDPLIFQVSAWRLGLQCSLVLQPKVLGPSSTLLSPLLPCCPCDLHSLLLYTVDIHLGALCGQWTVSHLREESTHVQQIVSIRVCGA